MRLALAARAGDAATDGEGDASLVRARGRATLAFAGGEAFDKDGEGLTDEGKAAQRAMKTRRDSDDERLTSLFQDVVTRARVFQGGGSEVTTSTLRDAVETAANRSLIRLFPKFGAGDNANWGKVVVKARDGAPDADGFAPARPRTGVRSWLKRRTPPVRHKTSRPSAR